MRAYVVSLWDAHQRQLQKSIVDGFIAVIGVLVPHEHEEEDIPNAPQNAGDVG